MTDTPRAQLLPVGRIEAFSDGVIAVAITLLVLDLRVPEPEEGHDLGSRLLALWPNYLAYVISFLAIGIMWINHHAMLRRLAGVDHSVMVMNLLLLMSVVVLPFTTSLLANYLDQPSGGHLAALIYSGSLMLTSTIFLVLQYHLQVQRPHLLREAPTPELRRAIMRRAAIAPPLYVVAAAAGLILPLLTLLVCAAMGIYYLLPPPRPAAGVPSSH